MNCIHCGKQTSKFSEWKLRDGNVVCYDCCEEVLKKNEEVTKGKNIFYSNLCVLSYKDFKAIDDNPELALTCIRDDMLPVSPFKEFQKKFLFERTEWMGRWSKKIKTAVLFCENYLEVSKVYQRSIGKRVLTSKKINYSEIATIYVVYKPTKWQLGLGCLVAVLSLVSFNVIGMILTALLLWQSYGYEIRIKSKGGEIVSVPIKSKKDDGVIELFNLVEQQRLRNQ